MSIATTSSCSTSPALHDAGPLARLNDDFRRSFSSGRVMLIAGIAALPAPTRDAIMAAVRGFDRFEPNNDPYGEHDFGAVTVAGEGVFWKIDAYDRSLTHASPDPSDPAVTVRILSIMLAEEY